MLVAAPSQVVLRTAFCQPTGGYLPAHVLNPQQVCGGGNCQPAQMTVHVIRQICVVIVRSRFAEETSASRAGSISSGSLSRHHSLSGACLSTAQRTRPIIGLSWARSDWFRRKPLVANKDQSQQILWDRTVQQTHAVLSIPSLKEFSASAEEDTGYQNHAVCITPSLEQVCASTEAVLSIRVHQNHIHPLPDVAFC